METLDNNIFQAGMQLLQIPSISKALASQIQSNQVKLLANINFQNILAKISPQSLPRTTSFDLNSSSITIGPNLKHENVLAYMKALIPWRKGPFTLFGHYLDSEWNSNLKWQRIHHLSSDLFFKKNVLDIGCQNAYYLMKILGEGAERVVGIDRHFLGYLQTCFCRYLIDSDLPMYYLFSDLQSLAESFNEVFDTVMCLGVLTHQKEPVAFLNYLKQYVSKNSKLVLETMIHAQNYSEAIHIKSRYAGMINCYQLPSKDLLIRWLKEAGFKNTEWVNTTQTSTTEQRVSEYSSPVSLSNHLDPNNQEYTVEGYPRPQRAILVASL